MAPSEFPLSRPRAHSLLLWSGFAFGATAAYFSVRDVHAPQAWDALVVSNYWWLLPSLVVLCAAVMVRAVRWQFMFTADARPRFTPVLRALLVGYLLNNILPLRAGEAGRVVALQRWGKVSLAETTGTVVTERIYDVLVLLLLFFAAMPWVPDIARTDIALALFVLVALLVGVSAFVLRKYEDKPLRFLLRPLSRIRLPLLGAVNTDEIAMNVTRGLATFHRGRLGVLAFVLSVISWLLLALSAWFILLGFKLGLSPIAGVLLVVATGLVSVIPAPPAAVGVFEGAVIVALAAYGVSSSVGLSFAFVFHAVNVVPFLIAGVVALRLR